MSVLFLCLVFDFVLGGPPLLWMTGLNGCKVVWTLPSFSWVCEMRACVVFEGWARVVEIVLFCFAGVVAVSKQPVLFTVVACAL